jgi:hypothetical protein
MYLSTQTYTSLIKNINIQFFIKTYPSKNLNIHNLYLFMIMTTI